MKWMRSLPRIEAVREYAAAIARNDRVFVEACERLPQALQFLEPEGEGDRNGRYARGRRGQHATPGAGGRGIGIGPRPEMGRSWRARAPESAVAWACTPCGRPGAGMSFRTTPGLGGIGPLSDRYRVGGAGTNAFDAATLTVVTLGFCRRRLLLGWPRHASFFTPRNTL